MGHGLDIKLGVGVARRCLFCGGGGGCRKEGQC